MVRKCNLGVRGINAIIGMIITQETNKIIKKKQWQMKLKLQAKMIDVPRLWAPNHPTHEDTVYMNRCTLEK